MMVSELLGDSNVDRQLRKKTICFLALFTITLWAEGVFSAPIYKCVDEKGNTSFSDRPCAPSAETLDKTTNGSSSQNAKAGAESSTTTSNKAPNSKAPKKRPGWGGYVDRARNIGGESSR